MYRGVGRVVTARETSAWGMGRTCTVCIGYVYDVSPIRVRSLVRGREVTYRAVCARCVQVGAGRL